MKRLRAWGAQRGEATGAQASVTRTVLRSPRGIVALAVLSVLLLAAVFASVLAPYSPVTQNLAIVRQGPSSAHLLGTDALGRDILSRLLYGGRGTIVGVLEAVAVFAAVGTVFGVTTGFIGGLFDRIAARVVDLVMSIPAIIVVLAVLAVFHSNMTVAMVTVGFLGSAGLVRVVRGAALAAREELYIDAGRLMGLTTMQLIVRHVLPRCRGAIVVQMALFAAITLGIQTGLDFLSLGPQPPTPTWGGMVADAAQALYQDPWLLVPPGVTIALAALSFGTVGDVVSDSIADQSSVSGGARARRLPAKQPATPTESTGDALLSVEHLTVSVEVGRGVHLAVDDVSFNVMPGETVGLVGESGSGKSMTARAIIGLLAANARVTGGGVWLDGQDITAISSGARRRILGRKISMISQEPMLALDPTYKVGSSLAEVVRSVRGISRKAARAEMLELLRSVQIVDPEGVARRYPHQLSGGMAQRVAIAMALAGNPDLLIADEPTTALDVTVQAEILDLLRAIQRTNGMSVLLVTHDWGVVADACSRVVVMYSGQVVERASVGEVFGHAVHPYTRSLLDSRPELVPPGALLPVAPGSAPPLTSEIQGCRFRERCEFALPECAAGVPLSTLVSGRQARCVRANELAGTEPVENVSYNV